jgi:hypothetical protein
MQAVMEDKGVVVTNDNRDMVDCTRSVNHGNYANGKRHGF